MNRSTTIASMSLAVAFATAALPSRAYAQSVDPPLAGQDKIECDPYQALKDYLKSASWLVVGDEGTKCRRLEHSPGYLNDDRNLVVIVTLDANEAGEFVDLSDFASIPRNGKVIKVDNALVRLRIVGVSSRRFEDIFTDPPSDFPFPIAAEVPRHLIAKNNQKPQHVGASLQPRAVPSGKLLTQLTQDASQFSTTELSQNLVGLSSSSEAEQTNARRTIVTELRCRVTENSEEKDFNAQRQLISQAFLEALVLESDRGNKIRLLDGLGESVKSGEVIMLHQIKNLMQLEMDPLLRGEYIRLLAQLRDKKS